jgi:acyl-CoA thioester hydrolase
MFRKQFIAGWGDMDFNGHMRNTAYLDRAADVRMIYFAENGFPMSEFVRLRLGPVVKKDEIEYFREIHLLESFNIGLSLLGLSEDGSRMLMLNEFFVLGDKLAARVSSLAGWLDLSTRKLTTPPEPLFEAMCNLPRAQGFQNLK